MSYNERCRIFRRPEAAVCLGFIEKSHFSSSDTIAFDLASLNDSVAEEKRLANSLLPHEVVKADGFFNFKRGVSSCRMRAFDESIRGDVAKGDACITFSIQYPNSKAEIVTKQNKFKIPKNLGKLARKFQRKPEWKQHFTTLDDDRYQVIYHKVVNGQKCRDCNTVHLSIYSILLKEGDDPKNAVMMLKFLHMPRAKYYWLYDLFGLGYDGLPIPERIEIAK